MKKFLPLLFLLIATVAVVACGDDSKSEPETTDQASTTDTEPASETTAKSSEPDASSESAGDDDSAKVVIETEELPQPGGGVFRRLWADPPTLDPHLTGDTTSAGVVVEIFSGLVSINTDLELVPDIAQEWQVDETGMVYTFALRDNVTFHNGKKVTAEDFKWSIERAASPQLASHLADTYLNDIIGAEEYIEGDADSIEGIQVIDERTLQITIDAPKAYFLAKLSYPTAFVLDRETVESGGRNWWVENAVGTGPFKLDEYRIGERIVLKRFDEYYRAPRPDVDAINMNLAGGQRMAMYENDEIDVTGVGLFDLERVLNPEEPLNKELVVAPPGFSVSYIGMNASEPPFDDPNFRRALNHAVDKELIADEVLAELVKPAYSILPPDSPATRPTSRACISIRTSRGSISHSPSMPTLRPGPALSSRCQARAEPSASTSKSSSRCGSRSLAWRSRSSRLSGRPISKIWMLRSSRPTPDSAGPPTIPTRRTSWTSSSTPRVA